MWAGHEEALVAYALAVCEEWCLRGHRDRVARSAVEDLRPATGIERVRSQPELGAAGGLPLARR